MRSLFVVISLAVTLALLAGAFFWSPHVAWAFVLVGPIIMRGVIDMTQTRQAVRRNFPVIGNFRYLFEVIRPEINQYFVDSKMCANWGFPRMAKHFYDESIDEMKDADDLIERILYLDGIPNLQRLGTVRVGEDVREKLELALQLEREAITRLNAGIAT